MSVPHAMLILYFCTLHFHGHERSSLFIYRNMSVPHVIGNERYGSIVLVQGHGRSSLFIYTNMSAPHVIRLERHGNCKVLVHGHERSSLFIYRNMSVPHVIGVSNERHGSLALLG